MWPRRCRLALRVGQIPGRDLLRVKSEHKNHLPGEADAMIKITPLGDSALVIQVRENFDAPEETLNEVLSALGRIRNARIPGIIELAPAYTTVGVFFDPIEVIANGAEPTRVIEWLQQRIDKALVRGKRHKPSKSRLTEVPVCFETDFAFDLDDVASHARMSPGEVLDLYCSVEYRVSCLGFTSGFPFLTGLPKKLATPRRATPRKEIAAGSVAIGGEQTGIYPLRSPGGWNVIGRTPLCLFDPAKDPPALLRAGDRVRFRATTGEEFEKLKS
jgi:inhibitor of KinA